MNSVPLVSVVIPVFNRVDSLRSAIWSVFQQSYPNLEVIVVDDGSSVAIEEGIPDELESRVCLYRLDRNRGATYARNFGIRLAGGKYIAFLDSDDCWMADKIAQQIKLFEREEDEHLALVFCGVTLLKREHSIEIVPAEITRGKELELFLSRGNLVCGGFSSVVARRDWLLNVGMLDEKLRSRQDLDLHIRLALAGARFESIRRPLVEFKHFGEGRISTNHRSRIIGLIRLHRKHKAHYMHYDSSAFGDLVEAARRLMLIGRASHARRVFYYSMRKYYLRRKVPRGAIMDVIRGFLFVVVGWKYLG